jgi:hypothetical protein
MRIPALFPDAKVRKNLAENVFHVHVTGDAGQRCRGFTQGLGDQFGGIPQAVHVAGGDELMQTAFQRLDMATAGAEGATVALHTQRFNQAAV